MVPKGGLRPQPPPSLIIKGNFHRRLAIVTRFCHTARPIPSYLKGGGLRFKIIQHNASSGNPDANAGGPRGQAEINTTHLLAVLRYEATGVKSVAGHFCVNIVGGATHTWSLRK